MPFDADLDATDALQPRQSIADYADREASTLIGPHRTPPPAIAMSLRERFELRRTGHLPAEHWQAVDDDWFAYADSRYRATVSRKPMPYNAPPVRLGVKDTVDVAGFPTTLGLRRHRHHPRHSAAILQGISVSAAMVTAKLVTTELNIGVGSGCINPYAPSIDPAGSSTGAGVAVAAGIVDVALGTDVLGSVRWPAGHCGTVGLRTTHDSASLAGVFPLSPPMDAIGWVARTARDLSEAIDLCTLPISKSRVVPLEDGYRVGVIQAALDSSVEPMVGVVEYAAALLEDAGATIVPGVAIEALWSLRGPAWELCARQGFDAHVVWREWIDTELHASTLQALDVGSQVSDSRYENILASLTSMRRNIHALFDQTGCDVWLLPLDANPPPSVTAAQSTSSTIPHRDDSDYAQRIGFTPLASVAGIPAITIPLLKGDTGAPLCVQILARPDADHDLIQIARQLEDRADPLSFSPL